MKRILILNRRYCPGEAWTNRTIAYAKGLAEAGNDVCMCYMIPDIKGKRYSLEIPGVRIVNLWESVPKVLYRFRLLLFALSAIKFLFYVKRNDSLFFYGGYNWQLMLTWLLNNRAYSYCEVTEHPDINSSSKNIWLLNKLSGLFVISQSLYDCFKGLGVEEHKLHVVNMFVDTDRFRNLSKTASEKYIAYCGAVSYDKDGVDRLLKAFSIFSQKFNEYKLYIIGKGITEDTISKLELLVSDLGIGDKVIFTGYVHPDQMPAYLYNATILALCRPDSLQARNGFPTKLGEYLATGNPVVVTDVGEIPLYIKHNENGYLADSNSIEDFSSKLVWVAEHLDEANIVGAKGQHLVLNEFNYKVESLKVSKIMDAIWEN